MCGIVGLSVAATGPSTTEVVERMAARIAHRGPNSFGQFASSDGTAHVGFRRLAIRDLHSRANQPMRSASGRSVLVFNGEIYNSDDLARRYLAGLDLRTSGDAEVVLEVLERAGLEKLSELNGMFALALVDTQTGRVTLARDRMGKKPLYLHSAKGLLAFASELRSLKPFGLRVDPAHVGLYFHFGYFPSPYTFYVNTTQVCPGEVVQLEAGEIRKRYRFHRFSDEPWSQRDVELDEVDELLTDAARLRQIADVPLGAFLSGGVDSSLVAAHLQKSGVDHVPTFTLAFPDQFHDESADAAETAAELSLPHRVIDIEEQNLAELAVEFQDCYEQPYADTSGLVTMLLCRTVKQHVTVALSGDGGDEFFGGYARYDWFRKALLAQRCPHLLRRVIGECVRRAEDRRGPRLAGWLRTDDPAALYAEILRNWNATEVQTVVPSSTATVTAQDMVRQIFDETAADPLAQAACFDASYYIPDDLQVKLDRASMRVALEVRCPLLDYRVAKLGIALQTRAKYRRGLKTTLKELLRRRCSTAVVGRPKRGFSVPLTAWLRGPMRPLVEDTIRQRDVVETGWFESSVAQQVWQDFLAGRSQHAHSVWMMLSLMHHLREPKTDPVYETLCAETSRRAA